MAALGKPTLAMLGGFSAAAGYRILSRMVDTIESVFRGETRDIIAAREQAVKSKFEEQGAQNRMQYAADLVKIQHQLASGVNTEDLKQSLDKALKNIIPEGFEPDLSRTDTQKSNTPNAAAK